MTRDLLVSMTPDAFKPPAKKGVDPRAIVLKIRDGGWRKPVEAIRGAYSRARAATDDLKAVKESVDPLKKALPGVMFAGLFTKRGNAHLETYSGLLCADLDALESGQIEQAFAKAQKDQHVVAAFTSPTGTGLKIIFRVAGTADQHDKATFRAVRQHVADDYGLHLDESCKNLERLCFVSFDPRAFWNEDARPLAPACEPASTTPRTNGATVVNLAERQRVAVGLFGAVDWKDGTTGFCQCPGQQFHTSANAQSDCRLTLDGAPTLFCLHNSCRAAVDAANHDLRSSIGKAEYELSRRRDFPTRPAIKVLPDPVPDPDFDRITADVRGEILAILTDANCKGAARNREVAKLVVDALAKVGRLYFHAERRDFDSAMFFDGFAKRLLRIRSDAFGAWLSEWLGINRADPLYKYAFTEVETAALSGTHSTAIMPEQFWAARPGSIFLSNGDGAAVRITAQAFETVDNGTDGVLFAAGRTLAPWALTKPRDAFEACRLFRDAHCSAAHGKDLLRLWLYSLPSNPKCKPPLCLPGPIGSGKTRTAKAFAEFYGIPFVAQKVEEDKEADFWPCCDGGGIFTPDNADTRCRWLADALANAATDGCSQRRRLYTDSETVILRARAWICVTTANPTFASDSGLADRLLVVRMDRRDGEDTSDALFTEEILAARDAGLSHLAGTLRAALADTAPTPPGLNARHPDFAAFAVRIGRALGRETEAVAALKAAEADKATFCLENDSIAAALLAYLREARTFTGTASELAPHLCEIDPDLSGKLSTKRLGKRLAALWPHLQRVLATARREKDRKGHQLFTFKSADVCLI